MRAATGGNMLARLMDVDLGLALLVGLALTAGAILLDTRQRVAVSERARRDAIEHIVLLRRDLPDRGRRGPLAR